jgi:hypothetical protein
MSKSLLAGGELGNIGTNLMREQRELIAQKWEAVGLLEGFSGFQKGNMAQLLENQASWMVNESTTTDSSGSFETVVFPVIRRVFSKLLANEIVSVQALDRPNGRIYYYNPKISKRVNNGHTPLDGGYSNAAANYSLDADGRRTGKTGGTQFETFSLYDAYYAQTATEYGDALFDRTAGKIFVKAPVVSGATFTNGVTKTYTVNVTGFTSNGGKMQGPVGDPMDTEEFLASLKITSNVAFVGNAASNAAYDIAAGNEIPFKLGIQSWSKSIVDNNGNLRLILDLSYPGATDGGYIALSGSTTGTPVFTASYSLYSDLEQDSEMAEVSFDLSYTTIDVGQPRKLRATFTPEVAADAKAYHNFDVEESLVSLMSQAVSTEIDRTILKELRACAAFIDRFDYNGFAKRTGITRQDYNQELIIKINQISAAISKSTLNGGGANWIVCSPEIAALFNSLEYFHVSDASAGETKFSMGIEKIGSLQNRYQIFTDNLAPANTLLLGHKGSDIFSTGYVYAPYTPIMILPKMTNYNDGTSVYILQSRFATKVINNRFYGKIYVDAIPTYVSGADLRA